MAVDRPTFHEAWYRVADLRPRLLAGVQVHRQHFRGQTWHVLDNPANNQFSRINEEGYRFIGLLNGRRTVAEVWQICNEQLGDRAPTQGEVIQLLGQLHTSNLLHVELPPDSEALFNRYRKRITREVQSYLMNLLFLRIPLLDPDRFLDRWVGIFGRVFSWLGLVLWLVLVGTGAVLRDRRHPGADQPERGRAGPGQPRLSVPELHRRSRSCTSSAMPLPASGSAGSTAPAAKST